MSLIKGILFDKDGTLFDFSSTWEAWAAAFLRRAAADEAQADRMGRAIGFDLALKRFAPDSVVIAGTPGEVAEMLAPHLPHLSLAGVLNLLNEEAEIAPQVEAVPLQAFLTDLRGKGYALGVVTNDAEAPARMHLTAAGVTQAFDFIAGFDSGFGAKPAPGPLLAFAQACDLAPEHVLMVGDSTHDLIAAARAGMRGVGVLTGLADSATLAPYADVVLPDIGHLPDWLQAQNRTPN
ncbi:HAD family hydrolase [Roseobacter weihaiensis]|uniref:HAD family hydrolase n=1 Tax=Roseobacter weihaiensis TaxID=2763262 RepID=UPI001D0B6B78|nr:HAD family hydrolase [Roseobacter sp. H9]